MKKILGMMLLGAAMAWSAVANAGIAVIVHPSVNTSALTVEQVSQLFMGRAKALPDGTVATPIDLAEGAPARVQFVERVLGKNEQQLRSYWSRMIFTGKGQPPRSVNSAADMVKMVASTPGFIGYVDAKDVVAGRVKVLYQIQ